MIDYFIKRAFFTLITIFLLSITIFTIVQIPPGDAIDVIVRAREANGDTISEDEVAQLRTAYGLDRPVFDRYVDWVSDLFRGDMGLSVSGQPVRKLVAERLPATIGLSVFSLLLTYLIAIPIGIYSAVNQYSPGDYVATTFGFIGLATPNFLLALILIFISYRYFGVSIGGFNSPEFQNSPFSMAKLWDLFLHLIPPIIVIATSSTAGTIRTLRATLLDELGKQYVTTARAKGVPWRKLLMKYPVRLALNPIVAGIGHIFPYLLAGQTIVAIVLNLPTLGPLLFNGLINQDIELTSSVLLIQSLLAIFGVVFSDVLLTLLDPRIRFEKGAS